jgi:hypothetical protein
MKPKLLNDVLRQVSPRKYNNHTMFPPNRYTALSRDSSPANSVRSNLSLKSLPIKRKILSDGNSNSQVTYAEIANVNSGTGTNLSSTQDPIKKL